MKATAYILAILIAGPNGPALSQGIWDDGLYLGNVRSEYEPGTGTAAQPLHLRYDQPGLEGCKFDALSAYSGCPGRASEMTDESGRAPWQGNVQWNFACGGNTQRLEKTWLGCVRYDNDNYFRSGTNRHNYWVLIANNDPAFDQCNSGPPGISRRVQSIAFGERGLFEFHAEKFTDEQDRLRRRFHFIINSRAHDFFCPRTGRYQASLPFISVGAQNGAGNDGPIGAFSRDPHPGAIDQLSFDYEVIDHLPYRCLPETADTCKDNYTGAHSGFFLHASWNGTGRMLFVELWRSGHFGRPDYAPGAGNWNWPIEESVFFPGAEIAMLPVGHPEVDDCGLQIEAYDRTLMGRPLTYQVDVSEVFRCAARLELFSDPLPAGLIDLEGVHWYSESYGTEGYLWAAVERISVSNQVDPAAGDVHEHLAYLHDKKLRGRSDTLHRKP